MKKVSCIVIAILVLFCFAHAEVFTVKTGTNFQTAQIGFPQGNLQPYVGLDMFAMGANVELDMSGLSLGIGDEYGYGFDDSGLSDAELDLSAQILLPHIGAKFYMNDVSESRPYVFGDVFKSFPSIKMEVAGEDVLDKDAEDLIKDILGFWGFKAGFGAEYHVSEAFSITGEYGLAMYFMSAEIDMETTDYDDYYNEVSEKVSAKLSGSLRNTFVNIGVNFYFD